MALRLVTAPAVEPITLAEFKMNRGIEHSEHDALITMLIKAVRYYLDGKDGFLGRALITQTWDLVIDEFPSGEIKIPLPPLIEVVSVEYDDAGGITQAVDPADYTVDAASEPGWVVPSLSGWPTPFDGINAVRIRFVAGYAPAADSPLDLASNVPFSIKAAMLLHVGSLYEHRETVVVGQTAMELPWGAQQLLNPYRVLLSMA